MEISNVRGKILRHLWITFVISGINTMSWKLVSKKDVAKRLRTGRSQSMQPVSHQITKMSFQIKDLQNDWIYKEKNWDLLVNDL